MRPWNNKTYPIAYYLTIEGEVLLHHLRGTYSSFDDCGDRTDPHALEEAVHVFLEPEEESHLIRVSGYPKQKER